MNSFVPDFKAKKNSSGIVHLTVILFVFVFLALTAGIIFFKPKNQEQGGVAFQSTTGGFGELIKKVFNPPSPSPILTPKPSPSPSGTPTPKPTSSPQPSPASLDVTKKVMLLIYNPILEGKGNARLIDYKGWGNATSLSQSFINDIKDVSGGYLNYQIVQTHEIDGIPTLADGFNYSDDSYLSCIDGSGGCHNPDTANYNKILTDFQVCEKRNSGEIDEVWIWGGPYFGYYESRLAGPGAFWYNAPALTGTTCQKLLPMMGFNYERGVSEALESFGHRVESTLDYVYGFRQPNKNTLWSQFTLRDIDLAGEAGCGNIHYGPNSTTDYDWGNTRYVQSSCNDWYNFPNLTGAKQNMSCSEWGCNSYGFKKWWYRHLPNANGKTNGKLNNWWKYIADYESAIKE